MTRVTTFFFAAILVCTLTPRPACAQAPRDGKLLITVVDSSNVVIPGATVTVTGGDAAARTPPPPAPVKSNAQGIATIAGLAPGQYTIEAEFPGFQTRLLKDVRVRSGDNKHVCVLAIQGFQDSVTVGRDAQATAADPRHSFGSALTREQIDALSDDPDEMA